MKIGRKSLAFPITEYLKMAYKITTLLLIVFLLSFFSCTDNKEKQSDGQETSKLFDLLDSTQTGISFQNTIENEEDF